MQIMHRKIQRTFLRQMPRTRKTQMRHLPPTRRPQTYGQPNMRNMPPQRNRLLPHMQEKRTKRTRMHTTHRCQLHARIPKRKTTQTKIRQHQRKKTHPLHTWMQTRNIHRHAQLEKTRRTKTLARHTQVQMQTMQIQMQRHLAVQKTQTHTLRQKKLRLQHLPTHLQTIRRTLRTQKKMPLDIHQNLNLTSLESFTLRSLPKILSSMN